MDAKWLSDKCFTVDKKDPVTKVLGWIAGDRRDVPVICDNGRPYGLVDARRIMDGRPHGRSAVSHVDWPVPVITADDSPETALQHFAQSHAPYLPAYIDRTISVLTSERLLDAFEDGPTAEAAMGKVPVLRASDDIESALQGFRRNAIECLPFADESGPRGVIHRSDMVQFFLEPEHAISKGDRAGERQPVRDDPLQEHIDDHIRILRPDAPFEEARTVVQEGPAFVVRENRIEGALNAAYLLAGLYNHRKHSAEAQTARH